MCVAPSWNYFSFVKAPVLSNDIPFACYGVKGGRDVSAMAQEGKWGRTRRHIFDKRFFSNVDPGNKTQFLEQKLLLSKRNGNVILGIAGFTAIHLYFPPKENWILYFCPNWFFFFALGCLIFVFCFLISVMFWFFFCGDNFLAKNRRFFSTNVWNVILTQLWNHLLKFPFDSDFYVKLIVDHQMCTFDASSSIKELRSLIEICVRARGIWFVMRR